MAGQYIINITNGAGVKDILNGDYAVTSSINGYDDASILPATQTISAGTDTYSFTVEATGALTLHVTEDGTAIGAPIVGASFVRCDSLGNTYGAPIISDSNGDAVFNYVPFAAASAPLIYYKQTASDGNHEFSAALANTSLTSSAETMQITNLPPATRTISLTDANYTGLPIETGSITLS